MPKELLHLKTTFNKLILLIKNNTMKFKLMPLLLFLSVVISCTKNDTAPTTVEISNDEINIYHQFEKLLLDIGKKDLDAMFIHSMGFILFSEGRTHLTIADLKTFKDKFKEVSYTELLPQIAAYDVKTAEQLALVFEKITRFSDVDKRINFLALQLEKIENKPSIYQLFLEDYKSLLIKISAKPYGVYRDCESDCFLNNQALWRDFYWRYCEKWTINPCTPLVFDKVLAKAYASEELRDWCSKQCCDPCFQVVCPDGQKCVNGICRDNCYQVFCNPGYYCDDGNCIHDPFYEECNTGKPCPTGQHCVGGFCRPW